MSYESKKSGFIVFNLLLFFHFYVHQVIFCLFLCPSVCLSVRKIFTEISMDRVLRNFVYKEYSYARDQSINQSITLDAMEVLIKYCTNRNFDLDKPGQKFHHSLKGAKSITKLVIFRSFVAKCCKMRII
jgi:hypothetical protein